MEPHWVRYFHRSIKENTLLWGTPSAPLVSQPRKWSWTVNCLFCLESMSSAKWPDLTFFAVLKPSCSYFLIDFSKNYIDTNKINSWLLLVVGRGENCIYCL